MQGTQYWPGNEKEAVARKVSKRLRGWSEIGAKRRTMVVREPPEAAIDYQEKRRSPRYSFIASAELIEEKADVRIASRVSELSRFGCYLDMMNPFPTGTMVLVKISRETASSRPKRRSSIRSRTWGGRWVLEVAPPSQQALERWLDEAEKERKRQSE